MINHSSSKKSLSPSASISRLKSYLSSNYEHFRLFYRTLLMHLNSPQIQQKKYFTEIYFQEIEKKIEDPTFWEQNRHKKLFAIPFSLKDNFLVQNQKTEGGSYILKNFYPDFDARVLTLLKNSGAILIGKNTMDELGLGGTGLYAKEGEICNPHNSAHIIGGSSSGSAGAVTENLVNFALASDTGDSARIVASYCGIVGFKPSFGMISRHGLIPYAPSLDTVGLLTQKAENLLFLTEILYQYDENDGASQKPTNLQPAQLPPVKKIHIGYFQVNKEWIDEKTKTIFSRKVIKKLKSTGYIVKKIKFDSKLIRALNLIYQILSYPEAISSQANLTGINFGAGVTRENLSFQEQIIQNRSAGFGTEIKRRYIIGALFTERLGYNFFVQAQKIRDYLRLFFAHYWKEYDFILHPATYTTARPISVIKQEIKDPQKRLPMINDYLLIGNFIGIPSLVLPYANYRQLPLGINIYAPIQHDLRLLKLGEDLAQIFNYSFPFLENHAN